MKLILRAIKALFRELENSIAQTTSTLYDLSEQVRYVRTNVNEVQNSVKNVALNVSNIESSVPKFLDVKSLYSIEPFSTTQLEVGCSTTIKDCPDIFAEYADTLPIGSEVSAVFVYVGDDDAKVRTSIV